MKYSVAITVAMLGLAGLASGLVAAETKPGEAGMAGQSNKVGKAKASFHVNLAPGPDSRLTRKQFFAQNPTDDPEERLKLEKEFDRLDRNHTGILTIMQFNPFQQAPASAGPDDEPEAEPVFPDTASVVPSTTPCPYAVVISSNAFARPKWKAVADALVAKHKGVLVIYDGTVYNALPELVRLQPRYTAFVARTAILGRVFVARVHRLTRRLDGDPYTDTVWGIISGDTPLTALRVAKSTEPGIVRSVISLTGVNGDLYDEIFTISDGKAGDWYRKSRDGKEERGADGDADRVELFIRQFRDMKPDALVGSGHATERNLEIPFGKGNLEIRDGKWVGVVNWRRHGSEIRELQIPEDDHPRIFQGAGNCLIGNVQKNSLSLAAVMMGQHHVNQLVGYTVPTWYGKGGWGTLGTWQQFGGTYSLAEAFYFNNQDITRELGTRFPASAGKIIAVTERGNGMEAADKLDQSNRDEAGMIWDRDVVAFYGDPALRVTLDPAKNPAKPEFSLTRDGNRYRFSASAERESKGLVAMLFPARINGEIEITQGKELAPVITDDFILIPGATLTPGKPLQVEFVVKPKIRP